MSGWGGAIAVGPLWLPLMPFIVVASAGAALTLGKRLSASSASSVAAAEVNKSLWQALLLGLLLARLAFVFEYRSLYLASPLGIIDIRDGGWNATAGLIGTWAFAFVRERRHPAQRRPLRWSLAAGTGLFFTGSLVLALSAGSGSRMPDIALTSLDGRTVRLDSFDGKPTVVNLWATWCPPCVREMPVLLTAQRQRPDIHVVFINQGEAAAHVERWLHRQQLPLRNAFIDPLRQASAAFKQQGYPTTLFFNASGELVSTRVGELSAATLDHHLRSLTR